MRPSLITATRSLMLSASSWSWVTNTKVIPTSSCSALSSRRSCLRILASSAPSGSSRSSTDGRSTSARQRYALLLAAGELLGATVGQPAELDEREGLFHALMHVGL